MGFGEIFIILFVVLLFFGSKSIPTIARTLGKAMREVKTASGEIQREIRESAGDVTADVQQMRDFNIKRQMEQAMSDDPAPKPLAKPAPAPVSAPTPESVSEVVQASVPAPKADDNSKPTDDAEPKA